MPQRIHLNDSFLMFSHIIFSQQSISGKKVMNVLHNLSVKSDKSV